MRTAMMGRTALMAMLLCTACASASTSKQIVMPDGATRLAPYSPAVRSGEFVFLSGTIGVRPGTSELVGGGIAGETRQTLENIRTTLRAAGLGLDDVLKCTVFLADIREYDAMNTVYAEFFRNDPPARSAVAVAALPLVARVEIECIAAAR